ncbi:MAG: hypothetical protein ABUS47_13260 [Steroidobacter sp.]
MDLELFARMPASMTLNGGYVKVLKDELDGLHLAKSAVLTPLQNEITETDRAPNQWALLATASGIGDRF